MSRTLRPAPPALEANDQLVTAIITAAWAVALVVLLVLRSQIPPRETLDLNIEVADVERSAAALAALVKGVHPDTGIDRVHRVTAALLALPPSRFRPLVYHWRRGHRQDGRTAPSPQESLVG